MQALIDLILILISIFSIIIGLLLFFNPPLAIDIQKKFYSFINWSIEPISMRKEIRNTKIMGLFLITVSLITLVYLFIK